MQVQHVEDKKRPMMQPVSLASRASSRSCPLTITFYWLESSFQTERGESFSIETHPVQVLIRGTK